MRQAPYKYAAADQGFVRNLETTRDKNTPDSSFVIFRRAIGRAIAHWYLYDTYSRKVRAPVDRLPGNTWARTARVVRDGKCHREKTAIFGWQG